MSKPKNLSRRKFVGFGASATFFGLCRTPAAALFTTILGGQSQKAWAQSLGLQPRNLVQILEGGSPARWMYDTFLTPYSSDVINLNPMVGTRFRSVGGRYIGIDYQTVPYRGVQVPFMWSHDLPAPNGAYRPMSGLLDNLLSIQGITTRNAGHPSSQEWHFLAPGAQRSTSALSADASDTPFAGLNVNAAGYQFRSTKSKTSLSIGTGGNMLNTLLSPFQPSGSSQFRTNKASLRAAYDGLLPSLDELARAGHPGAEALIQNRNSAIELAEYNFAALDTEWATLLAKYRDLVTRAIYDPGHLLAGLNDAPVGEGGGGNATLYRVSDTSQLNLHLAADLRLAVDARTTVGGLPESFAFTEYVLRNHLSSSIAFGLGSLAPLVRPSDGAAMESLVNDQHTSGLYPSTFLNILRHRAVAACLTELIAQLRAADMFNDTVISVSGEFNRNPNPDLSGSDHGFNGKVLNLYCGAFQGPFVVGNLKNDGRMGWGAGGTIPSLGRQLNLVDTAVTLAHLLRVPPPFTSTNPVVTLSSSGLVSNIGMTHFVTS